MITDWYRVQNEAEIPSPALLIFKARAESNILRMIEMAGGPERLRPHVKTHKLPQLVRAQLAHGITKFKCATVAEAEMTASAGAPDVMLALQPVGPAVDRLMELQRRFPQTTFSTIADAGEVIRALGAAALCSRLSLPVLLDLDCGMHRTGVEPGVEAIRLYKLIASTPGLRAAGLHAYDGHIHESDLAKRTAECNAGFGPVEDLRAELARLGLPVPCLVAGGTPTFPIHARHQDRELSPGTTVLWDFGYGDNYPDLPFEPAALLLTRVVSKPGRGRLCLDLGHKALAPDTAPPRVRLLEIPDAVQVMHSEEHLVVETPDAEDFLVGACFHGIPRHVCPTVALHAEAWVVENGAAGERWPITARARRLTL